VRKKDSNMNPRGIEVSRVVVHPNGWAHNGEKGMMHWWVLGHSGLPRVPCWNCIVPLMFMCPTDSSLAFECNSILHHVSPTYVLEVKGEPTHVVIPW
jgi:hypothetical protein